MGIGIASFLAPFLGVMLYSRYGLSWPWNQAEIAGLALSTTSVAETMAPSRRGCVTSLDNDEFDLAGAIPSEGGRFGVFRRVMPLSRRGYRSTGK